MPIYEYTCNRCGHRYSVLRPMRDAGLPCVCPECGEADTRRLLSLIAAPVRADHSGGPQCAPSG
jgi:putative FmdB family regulatory protein